MNLTERTKKIGERLQCPMCPDMPCITTICEHALERAIEVEALARELAKKMELMHMAVNALLLGEDVPVEVVDRITLGVSSVLLKAKEVLGDG